MSLIDFEAAADNNPVDAIEHLAEMNDWSFERSGDDEITISVSGTVADFNVSFNWMSELEALHLAVAFDFKVVETRKFHILDLLARINEQLWLGHFDLWSKEGVVMLRQTLLLSGGADVSRDQLETLLSTAVETAERYYPAFQFVLWAGRSAEEALQAVVLETAGNA
jgi:hypothetical protein